MHCTISYMPLLPMSGQQIAGRLDMKRVVMTNVFTNLATEKITPDEAGGVGIMKVFIENLVNPSTISVPHS